MASKIIQPKVKTAAGYDDMIVNKSIYCYNHIIPYKTHQGFLFNQINIIDMEVSDRDVLTATIQIEDEFIPTGNFAFHAMLQEKSTLVSPATSTNTNLGIINLGQQDWSTSVSGCSYVVSAGGTTSSITYGIGVSYNINKTEFVFKIFCDQIAFVMNKSYKLYLVPIYSQENIV